MGKLINLAASLAFMATLTGNLPWFMKQVRIAQIKLIQESKASKWPKAMTLPSR